MLFNRYVPDKNTQANIRRHMHTDPNTRELTIDGLLRESAGNLRSISTSARLDVELLLGHILSKSRVELYTNSKKTVSAEQAALFINLVQKRCAGRPVAQLIGFREFWSMNFCVTADTLIPRPETELLVECALTHIVQNQPADVLELGTGSGAVALAIARERPDIHVTATDICPAALNIARYNAKALKLSQVEFLLGDWYTPVRSRKFSTIIANPPYVSDMEMIVHDFELSHEPELALRGGEDGLVAIKAVIQKAPYHMFSGGWLAIEHGPRQGPAIEVLLKEAGFVSIFSYTDLQGHSRVTEGKLRY
jgi:release factor glutamine methyltransferase